MVVMSYALKVSIGLAWLRLAWLAHASLACGALVWVEPGASRTTLLLSSRRPLPKGSMQLHGIYIDPKVMLW